MARKFARGAEATVYGTGESVWITPILGFEIENDDVDKTPAAFIQRHTFKSEQESQLFSSPEDVSRNLDWQQIQELAGDIFKLSGLGAALADTTATFRDGEGAPDGADPTPAGEGVGLPAE